MGFQAEAYALPAQGTTALLAKVYAVNKLTLFGVIDIFKELYLDQAYTGGELLPVDGVPGSNYPIIDKKNFSDFNTPSGYNPQGAIGIDITFLKFLNVSAYAYSYNTDVVTDFTFVPVGSALDVSPFTTPVFSQKYVNGTNQNYPSTSETFIAQETVGTPTSTNATNNVHIRFTARNSRWLFNEMENLNNNLNCSDSCSNPFTIVGDDPVCTTKVFSLSKPVQRGATITWSVTPSTLASVTSTGNQTTLTRLGNGDVTLTATINNGCPNTNATTIVHVGVLPAPTQMYFNGVGYSNYTQDLCLNRIVNYEILVDPVAGASSYYWSIGAPNAVTLNSGQGTDVINATVYGTTGSSLTFAAQAVNACGTGYPIQVDGEVCGFGLERNSFSATPNPTTGDVQIEALATAKTTTIKEIQVTDKFGNIKKNIKLSTNPKKHKINIADLPADVYFIRIYDGKTWTSKKVIRS